MVKGAFGRAKERADEHAITGLAEAVEVETQTPVEQVPPMTDPTVEQNHAITPPQHNTTPQTRTTTPPTIMQAEPAQSQSEPTPTQNSTRRMKRVSIVIDADTHKTLRLASINYEIPMWAIINEAINASFIEHRDFDWNRAYQDVENGGYNNA